MLQSTVRSMKAHKDKTRSLLMLWLVMLMVFIPILPSAYSHPFSAVSLDSESTPVTAEVGSPTPARAPAEPSIQPLSERELVGRRDAYSRHFDLGEGEYVAIVGVTPLNYRDTAGEWQPIEAAS